MAICIIGGGFAGLMVAIKTKRANPRFDVLLLEKQAPESNTQISGMRLRAGINNRRTNGATEIIELFMRRNTGVVTRPMRLFAETAVAELDYWHRLPGFVGYEDRPEWFGPQWGVANRAGMGHGKSVLNWLRQQALAQGVNVMRGEAQQLELTPQGSSVEAALVAQGEWGTSGAVAVVDVRADVYVLAGGGSGGRLFLSTNKQIRHSSHELAYAAGLPLVDSTIHMIHPFGRCKTDGTPLLGCYETDHLAGASVYVGVSMDRKHLHGLSSKLLAHHEAHSHFPELVNEFNRGGGVVQLALPNGSVKVARVSHHYHHLGVETTDGVRVAGLDNLYAVGDASGLGYWTNHNERFPGFALVKSLVDAALVAHAIQETLGATPRRPVSVERASGWSSVRERSGHTEKYVTSLRLVNSRHLADLFAASDVVGQDMATASWIEAVETVAAWVGWTPLLEIALGMAYAHREVSADRSTEPLRIDRELVRRLIAERPGRHSVRSVS